MGITFSEVQITDRWTGERYTALVVYLNGEQIGKVNWTKAVQYADDLANGRNTLREWTAETAAAYVAKDEAQRIRAWTGIDRRAKKELEHELYLALTIEFARKG